MRQSVKHLIRNTWSLMKNSEKNRKSFQEAVLSGERQP